MSSAQHRSPDAPRRCRRQYELLRLRLRLLAALTDSAGVLKQGAVRKRGQPDGGR